MFANAHTNIHWNSYGNDQSMKSLMENYVAKYEITEDYRNNLNVLICTENQMEKPSYIWVFP